MDIEEIVLKFEIREFLRFILAKKKERNTAFSQRAYATHVGFTTSTFNEILKGKRKITKKNFEKISSALKNDKEFDHLLTEYGQARQVQADSGRSQVITDKAVCREMIKISPLVQKNLKGPLFCSLVIAANQEDFEFLQGKVKSALQEKCHFTDLHEVHFLYCDEESKA